MSHDMEELLVMLDNKITFGETLVEKLQEIQNVGGVFKLQRKIYQEIDFLKRVSLNYIFN